MPVDFWFSQERATSFLQRPCRTRAACLKVLLLFHTLCHPPIEAPAHLHNRGVRMRGILPAGLNKFKKVAQWKPHPRYGHQYLSISSLGLSVFIILQDILSEVVLSSS